jgi:hypothetical protein
VPKRESVMQFYLRRVREQQAWIQSCGGSLAGYYLHYCGTHGMGADQTKRIYDADKAYLVKTEEALDAMYTVVVERVMAGVAR